MLAHLAQSCKNEAAADQFLLTLDIARVWHHDLECIYPGANSYVEILAEWGRVSLGSFAPTEIIEEWMDDERCQVSFNAAGQRHSFIHDGGDYIALQKAVHLVNRLMWSTGRVFEIACDYADGNFLLVLDANEKQRLIAERHWRFL